MKTKSLTAAQIDTLAQHLSEEPIAPSASAKKAGDNRAQLLVAGIGEERAALAFTSIMSADTFDQAEARLILVLKYGNTDPAGETTPEVAEELAAAISPPSASAKPSSIRRRPAPCRSRRISPNPPTPGSARSWRRSLPWPKRATSRLCRPLRSIRFRPARRPWRATATSA